MHSLRGGRGFACVYVTLAALAVPGCGNDTLTARQGALLVTIINPPEEAVQAFVAILTEDTLRQASESVYTATTLVAIDSVPVGVWDVTVRTLGATGATLSSVKVRSVIIEANRITEIIIDLGEEIAIELPCDPTSSEIWPICTTCSFEGEIVPIADDTRCGAIECGVFDTWSLTGDNTAVGESECAHGQTGDIIANRCSGPGACAVASAQSCPVIATVVTYADLCERIDACDAGAPSIFTYPAGTSCGLGMECDNAGNCVPITGPETGCADGEREGFLDLESYPVIAACSGAWSVPGITRADLAPACSRNGGDDGGNPEGTDCSAADLCASGWHVCLGKNEVADTAGTCDDAVPPGTPAKGLLFVVAQNSTNDSRCDVSANANDVFGCGNLGTQLTPDKNCAPLERALASTQPDSCGFNEAEPPLGPWVCQGGAGSDLNEGGLVSKNGCPGSTCEVDGIPVGSSDKGGVLCCRD